MQHFATQFTRCVDALHPALLDISLVLLYDTLKAVKVTSAASYLAELTHRVASWRTVVHDDCEPSLVTSERQLVSSHSVCGLADQLRKLRVRCPEGLLVPALNVHCPMASVQQFERDLKIVESRRAGL
ncbi:MAG: hypothetical protein F4Y34_05450 [Gammaproteobacteria bacterium]|nr:hypothetical protein [Gammaproteobacteria bacterium]